MTCNRCKLEKDDDEFYQTNKTYCKRCVADKTKEWRKNNPARYKERIRTSRLKNKEYHKEYYKQWYAKNGRKRYPEKQAAHTLVGLAIRRGDLIKPDCCEQCDREVNIEAHHDDYTQPLAVRWLCNRCHRTIHTGY